MEISQLKASDVGRKGEKEFHLKNFKYLLEYLIARKARVFNWRQSYDSYFFSSIVDKVDPFLWRAEDVYFTKIKGGKIQCNHIFHEGIHALLVDRFKPKLKGYLHFHLLCEAIASMTDYYFFLEVTSNFGLQKDSERFVSIYKTNLQSFCRGTRAVNREAEKLVQEGLEDIFSGYKRAVTDMFEIYIDLLAYAKTRHAGKPLDFMKIYKVIDRRRFGPLAHRYNLANNILYVLSYCGASGKKDKMAVKECLKILNDSDDFESFLKHLGIEKRLNGKIVEGV